MENNGCWNDNYYIQQTKSSLSLWFLCDYIDDVLYIIVPNKMDFSTN